MNKYPGNNNDFESSFDIIAQLEEALPDELEEITTCVEPNNALRITTTCTSARPLLIPNNAIIDTIFEGENNEVSNLLSKHGFKKNTVRQDQRQEPQITIPSSLDRIGTPDPSRFDSIASYYQDQSFLDLPSFDETESLFCLPRVEENEHSNEVPTYYQNQLSLVDTSNFHLFSDVKSSDQTERTGASGTRQTQNLSLVSSFHLNHLSIGHSSSNYQLYSSELSFYSGDQNSPVTSSANTGNTNDDIPYEWSAFHCQPSTGLSLQSCDQQYSTSTATLTSTPLQSCDEPRLQLNLQPMASKPSFESDTPDRKIAKIETLSIHTDKAPSKCDTWHDAESSWDHESRWHYHQHSRRRSFLCARCNEEFSDRRCLNVHIRTVHTGENQFVCDICDKGFSCVLDLKKHYLSVHYATHPGELNPYGCDRCDERFARLNDLKHHHITHSEEEPFKCDRCGALFSRELELKWHCYDEHRR